MLPAPLTPRQMVEGMVVTGSVVSSPAGNTDMAGGHQRMPDLPLEGGGGGAFDVHQDRPTSGASPRVLDGMRGCQCRMTSYDQEYGGPDFSPVNGIQLHDPWLLWVRRSRLDYSAVVQNIGYTTWDTKRRLNCDRASASTRRGPHLVQCTGVAAVCDIAQPDVV